MIRLDSTSKSLQMVLAGAITTNQLSVSVNYSDATAGSYLGGNQLSVTNSATPVTICAAPASGAVRDIDYLSITNIDTSPATITVSVNNGGTLYTVNTFVLQVNSTISYVHGVGWVCADYSGSTRTIASVGVIPIVPYMIQSNDGEDGSDGLNYVQVIGQLQPRVFTETANATPTPNCNAYDIHEDSAIAGSITVGAPTGQPVEGQALFIFLTDNGTARSISWNSGTGGYAATTVALPSTTVISTRLRVSFLYNSTASKWECVGVA